MPFCYEQPTLIYDRNQHHIWHPDFTLPDYNGMIVEYAGMPDVPDYASGIRHKVGAYKANGVPALAPKKGTRLRDYLNPFEHKAGAPRILYPAHMDEVNEASQRGGPS